MLDFVRASTIHRLGWLTGRLLASSAVLLLVLVFLVPPASAAVTCSYDNVDTVTVDFTAAGESATLSVQATSLDIQLNGADCDTADTTNTTTIDTSNGGAADNDQTFTIDQSGGGGAFPGTVAI